MATAVQVIPQTVPGGDLIIFEVERAREYASHASADSTRRAYRTDWRDFTAWCAHRTLCPLPASPATVALYLSGLAGELKVATLQRRLSAISRAHKSAGFDSPCSMSHAGLRDVWHGIRRAHGVAPVQKTPALTEDIRAMLGRLTAGLLGIRDRALLLIGFAGAFRRSELVALDRADVDVTRDGLVVTIRRSKTDQEGVGRKIGIPYGSNPETCPVRAFQAWIEFAGIADGPLFRGVRRYGTMRAARLTPHAVALIVKKLAAAAGLDPAKYSGHSLRAGLATSAAIAGVSERSIMAQTGHRSVNMVRRYIRDGSVFRENAAAKVGL